MSAPVCVSAGTRVGLSRTVVAAVTWRTFPAARVSSVGSRHGRAIPGAGMFLSGISTHSPSYSDVPNLRGGHSKYS